MDDFTAQWSTDCPACGDEGLRVMEAEYFFGGKGGRNRGRVPLPPEGVPLRPDGFVFEGDEEKDQSTTDETVACPKCGWRGTLDDVALPSRLRQEDKKPAKAKGAKEESR